MSLIPTFIGKDSRKTCVVFMSTCPLASLHLSRQMKLNALFFCREAITAVCERRGVDVDSINVYLEQSRTPLPLLTTETAWLGGRNIRIRGKSQNLSLAACNQSLVVLPRKAIPGEMRFNLMHCSNSPQWEKMCLRQSRTWETYQLFSIRKEFDIWILSCYVSS